MAASNANLPQVNASVDEGEYSIEKRHIATNEEKIIRISFELHRKDKSEDGVIAAFWKDMKKKAVNSPAMPKAISSIEIDPEEVHKWKYHKIDIYRLREAVTNAFTLAGNAPNMISCSCDVISEESWLATTILSINDELFLSSLRGVDTHFGKQSKNTVRYWFQVDQIPYFALSLKDNSLDRKAFLESDVQKFKEKTEESDLKGYVHASPLKNRIISAFNNEIQMHMNPSFHDDRLFLKIMTTFPNRDLKPLIHMYATFDGKPATKADELFGSHASTPDHESSQNQKGWNASVNAANTGVGLGLGYASLTTIESKNAYSILQSCPGNEVQFKYFVNQQLVDLKAMHFVHLLRFRFGTPITEEMAEKLELLVTVDYQNTALAKMKLGLTNVSDVITHKTIHRDHYRFQSRIMMKMLKTDAEIRLVTIASLIGHPQSGKTSFTQVFDNKFGVQEDKKDIGNGNTGGIKKSTIETEGFALLDTCGYFFRVNKDTLKLVEHDEKQIKSLIAGLPEGVSFSRKPDPLENPVLSAQINSSNAVASLIFIINARVMYNPLIKKTIEVPEEKKSQPDPEPQQQPWFSWWQPQNWFGSPQLSKKSEAVNPLKPAFTTKTIHEHKYPLFEKGLPLINYDSVNSTGTLVNACYDILAQNVDYKEKRRRYSMPVALVVTHLDMIPESERIEFTIQLKDALLIQEINDMSVFFGQTTCEWDEEVIQEHEMKIESLMKKLDEDPNQDYTDKLNQREFRLLHINSDKCKLTTKGCNHTFTKQTLDSYRKVIEHLKKASQKN